jgi:hypothetical protein
MWNTLLNKCNLYVCKSFFYRNTASLRSMSNFDSEFYFLLSTIITLDLIKQNTVSACHFVLFLRVHEELDTNLFFQFLDSECMVQSGIRNNVRLYHAVKVGRCVFQNLWFNGKSFKVRARERCFLLTLSYVKIESYLRNSCFCRFYCLFSLTRYFLYF